MSFTSTTSSHGSTPSTSPTSQPMKINFATSSTSAHSEATSVSMSRSSSQSSCNYSTAWPYGSALRKTSFGTTPTAYVSDEDLFGDDCDAYLSEPPPPPRPVEAWLAKPLLPPVHEIKPRRCSIPSSKRRTSSASKRKV